MEFLAILWAKETIPSKPLCIEETFEENLVLMNTDANGVKENIQTHTLPLLEILVHFMNSPWSSLWLEWLGNLHVPFLK